VKDTPSPVIDREPNVEQLETEGRHDEEVHSRDSISVIAQEGDPALL